MTAKEEILELIAALRAEVEVESVSPERVGYLLARMVGLLDEYATAVDLSSLRQYVTQLKRQVDINGDGLDRLASDLGLLQGSLRAVAEGLGALNEVYCTEAEYQAMADAGTLDPGTKYYIYES